MLAILVAGAATSSVYEGLAWPSAAFLLTSLVFGPWLVLFVVNVLGLRVSRLERFFIAARGPGSSWVLGLQWILVIAVIAGMGEFIIREPLGAACAAVAPSDGTRRLLGLVAELLVGLPAWGLLARLLGASVLVRLHPDAQPVVEPNYDDAARGPGIA
jgi:hypothetical protein